MSENVRKRPNRTVSDGQICPKMSESPLGLGHSDMTHGHGTDNGEMA